MLIHGNTSAGLFFESLFDLIPDDISLIVPDLRGYGNSSYNENIETINDFSEDLKLLLDELQIKELDVLDWSLGGAVAMELATSYPKLVKNLILLSSGSLKGYPTFKKDSSGKQIFPEIYSSKEELATDFVQIIPLLNAYREKNLDYLKMIFDYVIYTGKKKPNDSDNTRWLTETLKQRNLVDANWALANFNLSTTPNFYINGNSKINNLEARTLIIWGDKDVTVPKYMFDENISNIKNALTLIYEGAGHSIIVDEPEKLVKDILDFIK